MSESPAGAPRGTGAGERFPAFLWALCHVPILLALYASPMKAAVRATPAPYQALLWATFLPQAVLLAFVLWVVGLPLSFARRSYRFAAPAVMGLGTGIYAMDALVMASTGFHLNGFFFRVLLQPNALRETGVPERDVFIFFAGVVVFATLDVAAGAWLIRRFAARRRVWTLAVAVVLLAAGERVYGATLTHFGGSSIFAASTTLPLQVPIRMETLIRKVLGEPPDDYFKRARASARLPAGVDPKEIRFARKPDVIFAVAESLPADHMDPRVMPNLWRRSDTGARFVRHYSGASSTNYTLFSLMYGLQAQKLEATVGSGRQPVVFPAFQHAGYQVKALAASCVDWMGLKDTVFGGVEDVETWCEGTEPKDRDARMVESARTFLAKADPDRPVFLFLFFFGTHFNYFPLPEDEIFQPSWDGQGGFKATTAPGEHLKNRARNAAHALDRAFEKFLVDFEAKRGKAPIVVFTGDHGEEFRQKGHLGHGSAVTSEQIHVPAIWFGPGVPHGVFDVPTNHVDIVPTLFSLVGDVHPPSLYADGTSMFEAPADRFVVSTVGWEPQYAAIGKELKVMMYAGLGSALITDPEDRPLPDGPARMAKDAGRIMRALRGEADVAPAVSAPGESARASAEPPRAGQ